MSRCFPYPPPGYTANTATNYALIESIKLQRDKERVKLERKKEKEREKKERNRKKKGKAKQESSSSSRNVNLISGGDTRELETRYSKKEIEDEIVERLENSSLSEEHGQPVCSQDPSYSSDNTQNSNNKRKRSTSPSNGIHGHGQHSLSSGWTEPEPEPVPIADDKTTTAACSKLPENDMELQFKNLIINCVPPSLHYDYDDQDWLFQRKHKCMRTKEKREVSNDMSCGTSALLPRAQYLDDAELYAFPFTVPF